MSGRLSRGIASEREEHRPYRFVIEHAGRYMSTHCPVCRAQNVEMWSESGEPNYLGGWIAALEPGEDGVLRATMYACLCFVGQRRMEAHPGLRNALTAHPAVQWVTHPSVIAWVEGNGSPRPQGFVSEMQPAKDFVERCMKQWRRFQAAEIGADQLAANLKVIEDKYGPKPETVGPTLEYLLESASLMELYFGRAVDSSVNGKAPTTLRPDRRASQYKDD